MARPAVELAVALLGLAVLALALLWLFRFVQYRRAVRRSHARWLRYEHEAASGAGDRDRDRGLDWPSLKPFMLSPIPEERLDSGRESETDSILSVRKDRLSAISIVPYGSFDQPQVTTLR